MPPGTLRCDLVVVGLGGSGLAAVDRALARGWRVIGLDRGLVAGAAAGANGGFLLAGLADFYPDACASWGSDLARTLYRDTLDTAATLYARYPGVCRNTGSVRVGDAPDVLAEHAAVLRRDGFPAESYVGPEGVGVLLPSDGVCDPVSLARAQLAGVLAGGAEIFTGCQVERVEGHRVMTASGAVEASRGVIVAVDGAVSEWVSDAQALRLHMVATEPLPRRITDFAVYRRSGLDYYQQLPDGRLLLGGGRDVDPAPEVPRGADPGLDPGVVAWLEAQVAELAPAARVSHRWAAAVGFTLSRRIVADLLDEDVWVLGGYNGTGNLVGRALAASCVDALGGSRERFDSWRRVSGSLVRTPTSAGPGCAVAGSDSTVAVSADACEPLLSRRR